MHTTPAQSSTAAAATAAPAAKACATCRAVKPLQEFARHLNGHDGRRSHCRSCCLTGRKQPKRETEAQRARRAVRDAARREGQRAGVERARQRYPVIIAAGHGLQAASFNATHARRA
jgi:hypothetical protein